MADSDPPDRFETEPVRVGAGIQRRLQRLHYYRYLSTSGHTILIYIGIVYNYTILNIATIAVTPLVYLSFFNLVAFAALAASWVYTDARDRPGIDALPWALLVFIAGGIPTPVYLLYRRRSEPPERAGSRRKDGLLVGVLATLCGVAGMVVSPPDPVTAGWYTVFGLVLGSLIASVGVWHRRRSAQALV